MTMLQELETATRAPMLLQDMQTIITLNAAGEQVPHDMHNRADLALHRVMTQDSRAGTLKSTSEILTKVVAIAREACGLGTVDPNKESAGHAAGGFTDFQAFKSTFIAAVAKFPALRSFPCGPTTSPVNVAAIVRS